MSVCWRSMIKSGGLCSNILYTSMILPASSALHANITVRSANTLMRLSCCSSLWGSETSIWHGMVEIITIIMGKSLGTVVCLCYKDVHFDRSENDDNRRACSYPHSTTFDSVKMRQQIEMRATGKAP